MSDIRRPRDSGQHLLGPHVVGQRVVVRRLIRGEAGPTGGPAMTDLLGVCLSWADGMCVVQPEHGAAVHIPIADIVSGKPVPPRPSPRLRVSPREAEQHTAALWPTVEVTALGEWQLRVDTAPAGRRRKRANSCLALGEPGLPVAEALDDVRGFYSSRGLATLLQVEADSALEAETRAAGWQRLDHGESEFWLASVARARRAHPRQLPDAELEVTHDQAVATLGSGTDSAAERLAEGHAGRDGDWVGLHGIEVSPSARRRGLGTAVVAALLAWAAEQGAMTAWLHVETENPGALAFWEALGFAPHHRCRYYAPPG